MTARGKMIRLAMIKARAKALRTTGFILSQKPIEEIAKLEDLPGVDLSDIERIYRQTTDSES